MRNKKKHLLHSTIAMSCVLSLLFYSSIVQATNVDDLEDSATDKKNEIASINENLISLAEEIDGVNQQIVITEGAIKQTENDLDAIQKKETDQYSAMKTRIKYLYETGNTSFLEILFSADDMNDFLNKAEFIQNVSDYDREMLIQIKATHQELDEKQTDLQSQQESLLDMETEIKDKQSSLETQAAEASTDLASINAEIKKAKEAEAAALAAEAAKQAASIHSSSSGSGGSTVNAGSYNASTDDVTLLAGICEAEAYGQYDYLLAVATVIMNRVNSSQFPNSISGVVYASGQFEPTWTGRLASILRKGPNNLSIQVAKDAINGKRLSKVSNCYYFLASFTGHSGINVGDNVFFQSW